MERPAQRTDRSPESTGADTSSRNGHEHIIPHLEMAFAEGRSVLPAASDDEAAVIEEWGANRSPLPPITEEPQT